MILIMIKNQQSCRRWNNPHKVKCCFILLKKRKEECRKYGQPAQLVPSSARLWLVAELVKVLEAAQTLSVLVQRDFPPLS